MWSEGGRNPPFYNMDKMALTDSIAKMSTGASTATGLTGYILTFVQINAAVIAIGISICGLFVSILFHFLNLRLRKKEFELNRMRFMADQEKRKEATP